MLKCNNTYLAMHNMNSKSEIKILHATWAHMTVKLEMLLHLPILC